MKAEHHLKRILFKYYAPASVSVFVVAMLLTIRGNLTWNTFAAIAAGAFAFAFGVQKQNLEETILFKELFEKFNDRYDRMSEDLNLVYQQPSDLPLTDDEKQKLFKYFNLCGEEYLYFEKGFVCREVWRAWENGMNFFRQNPRIKRLWDEELESNSYYGLHFDKNKKTKLFAWAFLLLLAATVPSRAQQTNSAIKLGFIETAVAKAEAGDTTVQFNLGMRYAKGDGVEKDFTEAVKWFRKASESGMAVAQTRLGWCYFNGQGITKNYAEAAKWFRKAAEQGDVEGQCSLGSCCLNGEGVPKDAVEAVKWYRKGAEHGAVEAETGLGWCYLNGDGVSKDPAEAVKWYRKAAEQGFANAQAALGTLYTTGTGVPKDYTEALKWFRKAADAGNPEADNKLGVMYEEGRGVPKSYVEAYMLYSLAAASGDEYGEKFLASLEPQMTPEQIAEGQQLAREFTIRKDGANNSMSGENPSASGTGFFITDDGYLISNNHVVKDATKVRLLTSVGLITAKVVKVDMGNDIALLKADGNFSALPVAASRKAGLGDSVITLGFPNPSLQGFAPKLAKGEIASLSGAGDDVRYFQISVPVQPGNSGGALVDEHGNVIGIVSAKLDASVALAASGALPENVNYAVKSGFLLTFLESAPEVLAKLKEPNTTDEKFSDIVESAKSATVMVLVY